MSVKLGKLEHHTMTATILKLPLRPQSGPTPDPILWTLSRAIELTKANHWAGTRRIANATSHCRLLSMHMGWDKLLDDITNQDLVDYRDQRWEFASPATVNANLAVVPVLYREAKRQGYTGKVPAMPSTPVPKKMKWWLNPDVAKEVEAWCSSNGYHDLSDYAVWSQETGLRVEETLRLSKSNFTGLGSITPQVQVPGTKTQGSQATVPLSLKAATLAVTRLAASTLPGQPLFNLSYHQLWTQWRTCAYALKLPEGATPKGFRRSFARALTSRGAPLPVVQQLLRHSHVGTTMEYLRLTGGQFNDDEVRKWL